MVLDMGNPILPTFRPCCRKISRLRIGTQKQEQEHHMGYYFEDHLSMFNQAGTDVKHSLNAIVRRFIGANPPHPITYRAYSRRGILRVHDYRYEADFTKYFR